MDFDLLGFHAFAGGFGQAAGDVGPAPEYRGGGTQGAGRLPEPALEGVDPEEIEVHGEPTV